MKDGDANTTYFHTLCKAKLQTLSIKKITLTDGRQLTKTPNIEEEVVRLFSALLKEESSIPLVKMFLVSFPLL